MNIQAVDGSYRQRCVAAGHLAARVSQVAGEAAAPITKKIETAYSLTLSRTPSAAEIKLAEEHLEAQKEQYMKANVAAEEAAAQAFASLARMLLGSNEFLYIE